MTPFPRLVSLAVIFTYTWLLYSLLYSLLCSSPARCEEKSEGAAVGLREGEGSIHLGIIFLDA